MCCCCCSQKCCKDSATGLLGWLRKLLVRLPDCLRLTLCFLCPPVAVFLVRGLHPAILLNGALCITIVGAMAHAWLETRGVWHAWTDCFPQNRPLYVLNTASLLKASGGYTSVAQRSPPSPLVTLLYDMINTSRQWVGNWPDCLRLTLCYICPPAAVMVVRGLHPAVFLNGALCLTVVGAIMHAVRETRGQHVWLDCYPASVPWFTVPGLQACGCCGPAKATAASSNPTRSAAAPALTGPATSGAGKV